MFDRLQRRLVLGNLLVVLAVIGVLGLGLVGVMDRYLVAQRGADLRLRAATLVERLQELPGDDAALAGVGDALAGDALVLRDIAGRVVVNTATLDTAPLDAAADAAVASRAESQEVVRTATRELLVVSIPLSGLGGVVQLVADLAQVRALEGRIVLLLAGAGLLGLGLALIAAWILATRAMRPIRHAFARQREFTADASHELRTPLSVVDAGLQVLARHPGDRIEDHAATIAAMRDQTGRMARLIGSLLTLARADAGAASLARVRTELEPILRRTVEAFGPLAAERGATITLLPPQGGGPAAGTAPVDADRIEELVGILVDNALRHGGPGVRVRVAGERTPRGDVELLVVDDGPGIPVAEREHATERFVRGDAARSDDGGSGLGLSIARWIAEAHEGSLALEDANPGLRVRVTLPG